MLTPEQVRGAVNAWSRKGPFRIRRLGDAITVGNVVRRGCHTLRVSSLFESRKTTEAHAPYHGGSIDDEGEPPELWDIDVSIPRSFENRKTTMPLPHTERVVRCRGCGGSGTNRCLSCNGSGKVNCPFCFGNGSRQMMQAQPGGGVQSVKDQCKPCMGSGKMGCTSCLGRGHRPCLPCGGSGKIKTFQQVEVRFEATQAEEVLGADGLPSKLLLDAEGETLLDKTERRIQDHTPITPEVDAALTAMLNEAHKREGHATRLIRQCARVGCVPVYEVEYTYGGPQTRRLWVYGDSREVYAPGAPWRWGIFTLILAAALLTIVAGVVVLLMAR